MREGIIMKKIKQMKYYSLIRNILKFELFYKLIVLFCLSPCLRWILQRYLDSVSIGIVFNQDMFYQFLNWKGILVVLFLFLLMMIIVFYELYVVIQILTLEYKHEDYSLRKIMLKSFANLKVLSFPSFLICGLYIVFLLPFIHIGFMSSYIMRWNIPYFIFNDLRLTIWGQLLICIGYIISYSLFIMMLFAPIYMCLKSESIIQATRESLSLWKRITMNERIKIVVFIVIWFIMDMMLFKYLPYQLLHNRDFNFYFLKYLLTSTPFRYSVFQYLVIWIISVIGMAIFLRYLISIVFQYSDNFITINQIPIDTEQMNKKIYHIKHFIQKVYTRVKQLILKSQFYQSYKTTTHLIIIGLILCLLALYLQQDAFIHKPWVIGHRGSAYEVENTIEAVKNANDNQADFAEIDIQLSKDQIPIVFHDDTLSRLTNSKQKVSDLTAAELKQIVLKQHGKEAQIVTFEELLVEMNKQEMNIGLLIELKSIENYYELITRMIEIIEDQNINHKMMFMSSRFEIVEELKKQRPDWWIGYCFYGSVGDIDDSIWDMNIDFMAMEESRASTSFVQKAVSHMIPVYIWTVNDTKRMRQYLEMGVSGLITDYCDRSREIIDYYLENHHHIYYYDKNQMFQVY